jgi:hypothetical protein
LTQETEAAGPEVLTGGNEENRAERLKGRSFVTEGGEANLRAQWKPEFSSNLGLRMFF